MVDAKSAFDSQKQTLLLTVKCLRDLAALMHSVSEWPTLSAHHIVEWCNKSSAHGCPSSTQCALVARKCCLTNSQSFFKLEFVSAGASAAHPLRLL